MRVFVTGATGFVGSAAVRELLGAGHQVLGLARSDTSADALDYAGAEVLRGSLEDTDSLRRGAAAADAVMHLAFIHDFTKFAENCETDRRAITAMAEELAGTEKPLIITSGTGMLMGTTPYAVETTDISPDHPTPRAASELAGLDARRRGVDVRIVRLPQVHGPGDHGFTSLLIQAARDSGVAAYIGDGSNVWPAVHRLDAGLLYRLVLERGKAGTNYHCVAEKGIAMRDLAGVISRKLDLPLVSIAPDEVPEHFGWFAMFAGMNNPASGELTKAWLGWQPTRPGLLADLENEDYFDA